MRNGLARDALNVARGMSSAKGMQITETRDGTSQVGECHVTRQVGHEFVDGGAIFFLLLEAVGPAEDGLAAVDAGCVDEVPDDRLLDAAEILFQSQGVSRTSLQQIAEQAGATRGAIYWHFKDKAALFNAMMERVTLPLELTLASDGQATADDTRGAPLERMRAAFMNALHTTVHDEQTRRASGRGATRSSPPPQNGSGYGTFLA